MIILPGETSSGLWDSISHSGQNYRIVFKDLQSKLTYVLSVPKTLTVETLYMPDAI